MRGRHRETGWLCQACDYFIETSTEQVREVPLWPGDEQTGVISRGQIFCPKCNSTRVRG